MQQQNQQPQSQLPQNPHIPPNYEHPAIARARNRGDYGILVLVLAIIIGAILLIVFSASTVYDLTTRADTPLAVTTPIEEPSSAASELFTYVVIFIVGTLAIMLLIRIMRQQFLGNCLHIEYSNYAWLRDWANQVSAEFRMPRVEIFITQNPFINAFAIGFASPYNIVLNSGAIRYLTEDELRIVVVHEMAHVKYGHTKVSAFTSILVAIPVVGTIAGWLLDFFYRRAEYTCDSLAYHYTGNPELVKNALIKVHVGPDVTDSFNDVAQQWQEFNTRTNFNSFSQTFSSHPFLVRRLMNINRLHALSQQPQSPPPIQAGSIPNAST
ncbi:M48 family metallopeptidase [Candidatus Saccharibacteria bacterium]|nr:M48 family metallopeptidase [Candidatus Saccharibacteria bacterium]